MLATDLGRDVVAVLVLQVNFNEVQVQAEAHIGVANGVAAQVQKMLLPSVMQEPAMCTQAPEEAEAVISARTAISYCMARGQSQGVQGKHHIEQNGATASISNR